MSKDFWKIPDVACIFIYFTFSKQNQYIRPPFQKSKIKKAVEKAANCKTQLRLFFLLFFAVFYINQQGFSVRINKVNTWYSKAAILFFIVKEKIKYNMRKQVNSLNAKVAII